MCLGFDFEIFFFLLQESHRVWGRGAATAPFKWPVPRYFGTWPKNKASQQRNLLPLPVLSALQAVKLLRLIIPANESLTVFTLHTHHALSLSLSILLPLQWRRPRWAQYSKFPISIIAISRGKIYPNFISTKIVRHDQLTRLFQLGIENLKTFEIDRECYIYIFIKASSREKLFLPICNFNVLPRESKDPRNFKTRSKTSSIPR